MYNHKIAEDLNCGIVITMKVIGSKWKPCILDAINRGYRRPSEIHRQIQGATPRVLDMQLRELEAHNIVQKESLGSFPLHTEYFLTSRGRSIMPIIEAMDLWGTENTDLFNKKESLADMPMENREA